MVLPSHDGADFWHFIGILLLVGFVGAYFWSIVAAAVVVGLAYHSSRWWCSECQRGAELDAERAEIVARADQQHVWLMAGDDRGVYGPVGAELMRNTRG